MSRDVRLVRNFVRIEHVAEILQWIKLGNSGK
jgi:hypothetical protein